MHVVGYTKYVLWSPLSCSRPTAFLRPTPAWHVHDESRYYHSTRLRYTCQSRDAIAARLVQLPSLVHIPSRSQLSLRAANAVPICTCEVLDRILPGIVGLAPGAWGSGTPRVPRANVLSLEPIGPVLNLPTLELIKTFLFFLNIIIYIN